jgi:UDP-N-acetylmuramoyl-tripeptide--D-alanyl-D-alanine ligase
MKIRAQTLSRIIDGALIRGDADAPVGRISIDTRTIEKGDWFLAFKGKNVDGHDFILDAINKGAGGIILSDITLAPVEIKNLPVVSVDNPRKALYDIAKYIRVTTALFPWYAITGSVGKTTAKGVINEILKSEGSTPLVTPGNFNTDIGVPLAISGIASGKYDAFVLEFAMRAKGEIGYLADMTQPHIALITNIAPVHLETLGSLDNIAEAKGELLGYLDQRGVAVLNLDDPYFELLKSKVKNKHILTFSYIGPGGDVRAFDWEWDDNRYVTFKFVIRGEKPEKITIKTPSMGIAQSAIAGAAACVAGKVPYNHIYEGLVRYTGEEMRMNIVRKSSGVLVILDCYNANPKSMNDALKVLSLYKKDGRTIAVMGGMLELGDKAQEWHEKVAEFALSQDIDFLISVGKEGYWYHQRYLESKRNNVFHFVNNPDVNSWLKENVKETDTVLIKGSRGFKLEEVGDGDW